MHLRSQWQSFFRIYNNLKSLFRAPLNGYSQARLARLENILSTFDRLDSATWKWDEKEKFSAKNMYDHLLHGGVTSHLSATNMGFLCDFSKYIWQ